MGKSNILASERTVWKNIIFRQVRGLSGKKVIFRQVGGLVGKK